MPLSNDSRIRVTMRRLTSNFSVPGFALHQLEGWAVVETDDPLVIGEWMYGWSDVGEHEVTPVNDYEGMRSLLG
jgi:hypothetical protein